MSIFMPGNSTTDFTKNGNGIGIIVGELDFDEKSIQNLSTVCHGETAPRKNGVLFDDNTKIWVLPFKVAFYRRKKPGVCSMPCSFHALSHHGLFGTATEVAARCAFSAIVNLLDLLTAPNISFHPEFLIDSSVP